MDKDYTVSSVAIGDWVLRVDETIDTHNGEVMDRSITIRHADMIEPFDSIIDAVEFAQSLTGYSGISPWAWVQVVASGAQKFHEERGWK